jgi:predicted PurR-regulated permease PerM
MSLLQEQPDFLVAVSKSFFWRIILIALAALLIVSAEGVLLTVFLGILLAILLRAAADLVQRAIHLNARWAYVCVLIVGAGILVAVGYSLGPSVLTQAHELSKTVPQSIGTLQQELNHYGWGRDLTKILNTSTQPEQIANSIKTYASNFVSGVTTIVAILAIALFLGANPGLYCNGALRLLPEGARPKAAAVFNDLAFTMKWWLIGQLIPMAVLGIGTMLGLWLLGIPLAFTLGLLTAAMLFIPYVGSVIAYIPTALVALTLGPDKVLSVTILYVAVHLAEGYIITPLVQRRAVLLPPALTLTAQLLLWEFAGLLGILAATPLAAAGLVLVQRLYLKEQTDLVR